MQTVFILSLSILKDTPAQTKNHRGTLLFGLNTLPLLHGRQRITDASPYGATKGGA